MGETDQIPDRRALDVGAVNENYAYWVAITKVYNDDTEHYNGFALEEGNSRFDGIYPVMTSPHPSSKFRLTWKQTLARYLVFNSLRPPRYCHGSADARMSTLPGGNDNVTMKSEQSGTSGQGSAKRRLRLTTFKRILDIVEKD
ncbi:hypothetical protein PF008_g20525 [Phytophthora fragariae]|uniref:Uncharacterized protein n=1 Tax=Phytophthora fragariae TaxID=53985 RepID=A0A6G0QZ84_9STRA|nr:hypothetical protein PF008_g20525 [Phytophthora fragariae]